MAESSYDVIVVGGGPAGSSAAYFLSQGGKCVLVLEKERLPRYKTCGGGLSIRFLREQFPFSLDGILRTDIHAISYTFKDLMVTIPIMPQVVGMVMREDLDGYLLSQSGADVMEGAAVREVAETEDGVIVTTQDGRRYTAAYLIAADGANSVSARAVGLRPRRALVGAIEAEVHVPPEVMANFGHMPVFIFGEIYNGYLWIFPKPDHLSVGIAAYHPRHGQLQKVLCTVMGRYGISLDQAELKGHPIPVYTRKERVATRRVLLVGDAAGLVDPLSGEGIRYAIKSGRLAAESILKGQPERYSDALFDAIGVNHLLTMLVAWFFYNFQIIFLFFGAPNPFTTQVIVDMLSDHATALELLLWAILTLPLFAVVELAAILMEKLGYIQQAFKLRKMVYPEAIRVSPKMWN